MRFIQTDKAPRAIGPYSQAVLAETGRILFLSGQIGLDPDTGEIVEGGIAPETERVLANIEAVLTAAGSDIFDVVKTTIYLKDLSDFQTVNEIYEKFFEDHRPARSTVEVSNLPRGARIEIEAMAARK